MHTHDMRKIARVAKKLAAFTSFKESIDEAREALTYDLDRDAVYALYGHVIIEIQRLEKSMNNLMNNNNNNVESEACCD